MFRLALTYPVSISRIARVSAGLTILRLTSISFIIVHFLTRHVMSCAPIGTRITGWSGRMVGASISSHIASSCVSNCRAYYEGMCIITLFHKKQMFWFRLHYSYFSTYFGQNINLDSLPTCKYKSPSSDSLC